MRLKVRFAPPPLAAALLLSLSLAPSFCAPSRAEVFERHAAVRELSRSRAPVHGSLGLDDAQAREATSSPSGSDDADEPGRGASTGLWMLLFVPLSLFGLWMRFKLMRATGRVISDTLGLDSSWNPQGLPTRRSTQFARIDRAAEQTTLDVSAVDKSIEAMLAARNGPPLGAPPAEAAPAVRPTGFGRRVA